MATEDDIKVNDYVRIPKGTMTLDAYWNYEYDHVKKGVVMPVSSREVVVRVSDITTHTDAQRAYGPSRGEIRDIPATFRHVFVGWGSGSSAKYALIADVTKTEAPVRKEVDHTKKKIQLRTLLVKGSKWKVVNAVDIHKDVANAWPRAIEQVGVVPVGTELTVVNKTQNYGPGWADGVWCWMQGDGKKYLLQVSDLKDNIEQVGELPVISEYVIWDTAAQKYYEGYDYMGYNHVTGVRETQFNLNEKLTKAKKFKRLADVRTHALIQSGYYYDLNGTWGSIPEWMEQSKCFDIPDSWVIREVNKITKETIRTLELVDTFKRAWKLRALTQTYGGSVRKIYSDLEKKDKLDEFSAVLLFTCQKDDKSWYWDYEMSPTQKAEVQEALEAFDKKDVKLGKGTDNAAIAVKDSATAVMVKLAYSGDLECRVIDFKTMTEVVQ